MPASALRPTRRAWVAVGAVLLVALAVGCGDDDGEGVVIQEAGIPCAQPRDIPAAEGKPPAPPVPERPPTGELVVEDIQPGSGEVADRGEQVTVQYFVISCGTGEQIFSTWDAGAPADGTTPGSPPPESEAATFVLMTPDVIKGLVEGISGMAVGGLRQIIVPAELAVPAQVSPGAQGGQTRTLPNGGTTDANDTLVFVVQLESVAPAPTTTTPPPATPAPAPSPSPSPTSGPPPTEP